MKIFRITSALLFVLFFQAGLFSMTGEEALAKFRGRMAGVDKISGIITWTADSGMSYTGAFKYLAPGNIYVKFSNPRGKILVSNGKKLWIYDPGSNICGIQDLTGNGSGGIYSLVNGYNAIVSEGSENHIIKLRNSDRHYSEITLKVDSTFFLNKAVFRTKDGKGITFSISNVDMSPNFVKSIFDFSVPSNAQSIKNPLNIR